MPQIRTTRRTDKPGATTRSNAPTAQHEALLDWTLFLWWAGDIAGQMIQDDYTDLRGMEKVNHEYVARQARRVSALMGLSTRLAEAAGLVDTSSPHSKLATVRYSTGLPVLTPAPGEQEWMELTAPDGTVFPEFYLHREDMEDGGESLV